ncbi:MAG TPA: carboxypeptidase-like regulatory domain-containing protein [Bryobacteraceae bacterium]|nr:carboxypeptidase-like regulatory domain-containing protein [Bryobacteraceae bacterium]
MAAHILLRSVACFGTALVLYGQTAAPVPPPPPPPPPGSGATAGVIGVIGGDPSNVPQPGSARPRRSPGGQESVQPAGPPGRISGRVVSSTGQPIRKADVHCIPMGGGQFGASPMSSSRVLAGPGEAPFRSMPVIDTTDASGGFRCDDLTPGQYRVIANRSGYVFDDPIQGMKPVTLAPGADLTGVTVKLIPHGVITGKVTDEDGDPVTQVQVQVSRETWRRGRRVLAGMQTALTNDLGEYRLAGLQKGKYLLAANATRFNTNGMRRSSTGKPELTYALTYHPGTHDSQQAAPIQLAAGQELRGLDIQLKRTQTVSIRGKVLDSGGAPLRNVSIMLNPEHAEGFGPGRPQTFVQADTGTFVLQSVTPGSYVLSGMRVDRETRLAGALPVQVSGRDVEDVVLTLSPPVEIQGIVRTEGDTPIDTSRIQVLLEQDGGVPLGMPGGMPRIAPDGSFTVTAVPNVRYRVNTYGVASGAYLKAAVLGQQSILDQPFTATPGQRIELVFSSKAASVTGKVVDAEGKPISNVLAVLVPDAPNREKFRLYSQSMVSNGTFSAPNVAPGNYKVFVFPPEVDSWQSPAFLAQQEARGTAVKVGEGESVSVQVAYAP